MVRLADREGIMLVRGAVPCGSKRRRAGPVRFHPHATGQMEKTP